MLICFLIMFYMLEIYNVAFENLIKFYKIDNIMAISFDFLNYAKLYTFTNIHKYLKQYAVFYLLK